jgi:hypothetical protein
MGNGVQLGRKSVGRPRSAHPKQTVIAVRGNPDWRDWIHRLATHMQLKSTDLIDRALIEIAQRNDFREQAPKR